MANATLWDYLYFGATDHTSETFFKNVSQLLPGESASFNVKEGSRVFIERIDIRGNVRTADSVIRREFRVVEGDAFNASKLRRSRQRIQDLNYFTKVDLKRQLGSSNDKAVMVLDVEEKSTGSLNLGVGYGTDARRYSRGRTCRGQGRGRQRRLAVRFGTGIER